MTFLHSKTNFEIFRLNYVWNKSSFEKVWEFKGKMKPVWLEDKTFNLANIQGDVYKMTFMWNLDFIWNERIEIKNGIYTWKYNLKDFKDFEWIKMKTQKLLLVKI